MANIGMIRLSGNKPKHVENISKQKMQDTKDFLKTDNIGTNVCTNTGTKVGTMYYPLQMR